MVVEGCLGAVAAPAGSAHKAHAAATARVVADTSRTVRRAVPVVGTKFVIPPGNQLSIMSDFPFITGTAKQPISTYIPLTILIVGATEGCQVEVGAGEEAVQEGRAGTRRRTTSAIRASVQH